MRIVIYVNGQFRGQYVGWDMVLNPFYIWGAMMMQCTPHISEDFGTVRIEFK